MQRPFAALLLALSTAATAAEPAAVPEPPRWPAGVSGAGEDPTPEAPGEGDVTITEDERGTVYEYRVGAMVYMLKVVPQVGPPYYFIDQDGDGYLESRYDDPLLISVPQWVLLRW
jgi:hypothetical protein